MAERRPARQGADRDDPSLATDNDFGYYHTDPLGLACPLGAHIRRVNPRDSLDPQPGTSCIPGRQRPAPAHPPWPRLRPWCRGRRPAPGGRHRATGLHFICLAANLARQFEFVQHTWLNSPTFNGLYDDTDPLVGSRQGGGGTFTVPARPVRRRYHDLPQFVRTRGGAYFFLPGISALRYLAQLPGSRPSGHRTG